MKRPNETRESDERCKKRKKNTEKQKNPSRSPCKSCALAGRFSTIRGLSNTLAPFLNDTRVRSHERISMASGLYAPARSVSAPQKADCASRYCTRKQLKRTRPPVFFFFTWNARSIGVPSGGVAEPGGVSIDASDTGAALIRRRARADCVAAPGVESVAQSSAVIETARFDFSFINDSFSPARLTLRVT